MHMQLKQPAYIYNKLFQISTIKVQPEISYEENLKNNVAADDRHGGPFLCR